MGTNDAFKAKILVGCVIFLRGVITRVLLHDAVKFRRDSTRTWPEKNILKWRWLEFFRLFSRKMDPPVTRCITKPWYLHVFEGGLYHLTFSCNLNERRSFAQAYERFWDIAQKHVSRQPVAKYARGGVRSSHGNNSPYTKGIDLPVSWWL